MVTWSMEHRIACVDFFTVNKSIVQTQRNFRRRFNLRNCPSRNVINMWVSRWHQTGSVADLKRPGRTGFSL
ncbi:hypothetical protein C0J52_06838 [Blattella germanica]|nr:hypothetical protein C0J52_06838 [Blattella germanica]